MFQSKNQVFWPVLVLLVFHMSCSEQKQSKKGSAPKVYLQETDDGFQLIRDNAPFFIKGACGKEFLKELREAGANTARVYDTVNIKATLDSAQRFGLAVIIDIPIPRFTKPDTIFTNKIKMAQIYRHTQNFVKTYKSHPALLYWMLGNEIAYPDLPGNRNLTRNFNSLIDLIHAEDPDHPVSTAIGGFDRSQILSVQTLSSSIDFISINIFGELSTFQKRKESFAILWEGPYVISELGVNGPWEAEETLWHAPIERTSSDNAQKFKQRYRDFVGSLNDGRFLGSLFFYWGNKQERTHTWFSSIDEEGRKSEIAFEFESLWKGENFEFDGPIIDSILLNGKRANKSLVLRPWETASAELFLPENQDVNKYGIKWDIREENWNYELNETEKNPMEIEGLIKSQSSVALDFITPKKEGPYRLYVTLKAADGYDATANIPFYILDPTNE